MQLLICVGMCVCILYVLTCKENYVYVLMYMWVFYNIYFTISSNKRCREDMTKTRELEARPRGLQLEDTRFVRFFSYHRHHRDDSDSDSEDHHDP